MYPAPNQFPDNGNNAGRSGVDRALQYTPPVPRENKDGTYIEFYAFDPALGRLRRKRIKMNRIKGVVKRRQHVRDTIRRLEDQLRCGWNPWIAKDIEELQLFDEALGRYEAHIEKMLASGYFRKETYDGYKSNIKIMREYIKKKHPLHYAYQFDRRFCVDFLDYVFIDRDNYNPQNEMFWSYKTKRSIRKNET